MAPGTDYIQLRDNPISRPFSTPEFSPSFPLHPTRDELPTPKLGYNSRPLTTPPRGDTIYYYTWWFEWLCILGSLLGIAITAIALKQFDGKPIPLWATTGTGLSLNSILSLVSTASRSTLMVPLDIALGQLMWLAFAQKPRVLAEAEVYNEAARGPWGAARLMWRARGRGVAALGSLLVIMAVALGFTRRCMSLACGGCAADRCRAAVDLVSNAH
jgi:hypothetical protein